MNQILTLPPIDVALVGGADPEPSRREDARPRHQIERIVFDQGRRARTYKYGRVDLGDQLQVLAQREINSDAGAKLVRQIERAFARSEALNDSATDAQRAEVHVIGLRVALLDESDVGAEVDVPVKAAVDGRDHAVIESASAAAALEAGIKLLVVGILNSGMSANPNEFSGPVNRTLPPIHTSPTW